MLDWTLLRAFLAAVETGSLSAAAARLGSTQPTLSRQIKALETQLGVTLFVRSVSGLTPTEAALSLVEAAQTMGRAAETLERQAAGRTQVLRGVVRLTASRMVATYLLPPLLAAFRQLEPQIQVEIVASDRAENLLRRDADIALRMFAPTQQALIARKIGDSPMAVYASEGYLARRGRPRVWSDLLQHDLLGQDRDDEVIRGLAGLGLPVTRAAFALRTDDQVVFYQLMLAGAGIGFAQRLIADQAPQLQRLDLDPPIPSLPIWLAAPEEVRTHPNIRRVADYVVDALSADLRRLERGATAC